MKHLDFSYCHRKPERSFFWRGKQMPVCARCTGIHVGYLSLPFFFLDVVYLNIWVSLLIMVPTYLDGTIQAFTKYESTNIVRFVTGIAGGIGSMSIISIIGYHIGKYLLTLI